MHCLVITKHTHYLILKNMQYIIEQCSLVKNPYYSFYLVSIDAKNQFNTFIEQAQKNKQDFPYLNFS